MISKIIYDNSKRIAFGTPPVSKSAEVIKESNEYSGHLYNFANITARARLSFLDMPIEILTSFYAESKNADKALLTAFHALINSRDLPSYKHFIILCSLLAFDTLIFSPIENVCDIFSVSHRLYNAFSESRCSYSDNAIHIDSADYYKVSLILNCMFLNKICDFIKKKSDRNGVYLDIA